jgi:YidC/Oxa1 family membrane protein insertase
MSFQNGNQSPYNKQNSPEDIRNMLVFAVVVVFLFFAYDHFILKPQATALRQAQQVAAQQQAEADGPSIAPETTLESLKPRADIIGAAQRLPVDNGKLFGSIALKGGRLDDISFYEYYKTHENIEHVELLNPKGAAHSRYIDYGWVASDKAVSVPGTDSVWRVRGNRKLGLDNPVTLFWNNGQGLVFERTLSVDENYLFSVTQKVTNSSGKKITLYPYGLISQTGLPEDFTGVYLMHEGPIGYIGDELEEIKYKTLRKEEVESLTTTQGWVGITEKFWLTSLIPPQGETVKYNFNYSGPEKDKDNVGRYQVDYVGAPVTLAAGESATSQSHIFTGAKKVMLLEDYGEQLEIKNFDLAVDFGIFWFMTKPFFYALHYLGLLIGNMGFAIIVLTIFIRTLVFPLTNASYRSFAKMKKVSPQVAELREQYDDKQQLQQELMKLYQAEGVNPMAGCFPILLQIPIFFALYKTLYVSLEIRHAPFIGWIQDLSAPDPTSVFNLFGLIPWGPPAFLMIGAWPCVMLVAQLLQKKLNPPPQDPLQRDMANYFPFIITFILAKFPSGLVIYWACSAWLGLIQQMIIMRSMDVPIHLFGETEDEKKIEESVKKGGPAVHPLVEMAEDEIEETMFGDHEDETEKKPKVSKPKPKKSKKKK